ncbi:tauD [Symbiodinium sp. KB8]|nr:tauD [Symbiodinium sp. KB8]
MHLSAQAMLYSESGMSVMKRATWSPSRRRRRTKFFSRMAPSNTVPKSGCQFGTQMALSKKRQKQAPPSGGATCFADAVAAWKELSLEKQERLQKLICICSLAHHDAKIRLRNPAYPMMSHEERCRNPARRVPLCLQHPETGQCSIYGINSSTCSLIDKGQEMCPSKLRHYEETGEEDDSVAILRDLLVHATAPQFTIVWNWLPGDFAICDTRSTMHCATSYDQNFTREMWRTTIMPDPCFAVSFDAC